MKTVSEANKTRFDGLAQQYGFTAEAVSEMFQAVADGDGRTAQFNNPEFGGQGQWISNGMTMIAEMNNAELKTRVNELCENLARLVEDGTRTNSDDSKETRGLRSDSWWPSDLGSANSSGSQGSIRYAYFDEVHRLAVDDSVFITVYDTGDNHISGVSQVDSKKKNVIFASQHGPFDISALRQISRKPTSI